MAYMSTYTGNPVKNYTGNKHDDIWYAYAFQYDCKEKKWKRIPVTKSHRLPDDLFEVK